MKKYFVRYEPEKLYFEPPEAWNGLTFAAFEDHPPVGDIGRRTCESLHDPIQSPPLNKRLAPDDTVAVIIEDQTRNSPKGQVLRAILDEL